MALSADAAYAPRTITVARVDIVWRQARAHVDGRVGVGQNQPIDLKFSADGVDVQSLLEVANRPGLPISGTLVARGTVSGTTTKPMATITTQGSDLVAYEEQIGSLNADIRLDGRQLTLSELAIDKPQPEQSGRITATGTYDLDRRTYTFDLQSQGVRLIGLVLPDGQPRARRCSATDGTRRRQRGLT